MKKTIVFILGLVCGISITIILGVEISKDLKIQIASEKLSHYAVEISKLRMMMESEKEPLQDLIEKHMCYRSKIIKGDLESGVEVSNISRDLIEDSLSKYSEYQNRTGRECKY